MAEQIIEIKITGLTSRGEGLGRVGGLVVFVPGALPGEIVWARHLQVKKNFGRAELAKIILPSSERAVPACPVCAACGGCALQHLKYQAQLFWKKQWLTDALQRVGGLVAEVKPTIGAKQPTGYRDRVQLHADWQDGVLNLGFYRRGSRELTKGAPCLILRPLIARLKLLLDELPPSQVKYLTGLQHVALRCDSRGEQAMLILVGEIDQAELCKPIAWLMEQEPRLISVWANGGRPVYGIYGANWRKLAGVDKLSDSLGGLRLRISPGSFTQINAAQAERLYQLAVQYAGLSGAETVLDAYCGIGVIALYLADKAQSVIGVEQYAPAVADARFNAKLNGINNCRFVAGRVEEVLPLLMAQGQTIQAAVLDPPRVGCAAPALKALAKLGPKRIIYVSCDPATLARDASLLCEVGYTLREAQPLDMFPHTGHVEAVAVLEAKS